jgi:glycosyltransferase involved in cell wall biosynthesis
LRILSVSPYYDPEGGGLERYAHNILKRLAASGHDVRALAFSRKGASLAMQDGVCVERVAPFGYLGNAAVHPGFRRRVSRAIQESDAEVVLAHTPVPFAAEMAYQAAQKAGVPFVLTYHCGTLRGSSPVLNALAALDRITLERRMLQGSAHLIAVSGYVRDHALARHSGKVTVIPPGVDSQRFLPSLGGRGKDVLFVAPLDKRYRWKGLDVLWSAFRQVKAAVPEARLVLVGTGDRLVEFRSKAKAWHGSLVLPGRLGDDELVKAYQDAAVLVLPSTTDAESFGMVLAEANACGTPVVGSRIGGIPDFVTDGENGLLIRPGDAEGLADKLTELLLDPGGAAELGARGRAKVVAQHDWDELARRTENVLRDAVGRRGAGSALPATSRSAAPDDGPGGLPLPTAEAPASFSLHGAPAGFSLQGAGPLPDPPAFSLQGGGPEGPQEAKRVA